MPKNYKKFKLDPYLCSLRVYIDREAFNKDTEADEKSFSACTFRCDEYFAVFIPATERGTVSIRTAAHEAYHVADFILERIGMEYKDNSGNEHIAYLVGHICECIAIAAEKLTAKRGK